MTPIIMPAVPTASCAAKASAAHTLRVEPVTDYESFVGLEQVWNQLADEAGIDHPFLRHEWVRTWWECFGADKNLLILIVKDGTEPIAIAPLMLKQDRIYGIKVRRIEFLHNVHTPRFDFLLARRPKDACETIWRYLLAQKTRWDVLELRQLPVGSPALEILPRLATENSCLTGRWNSAESPYVPVHGTWESYLEQLDRKHRSNLRNRLKRLSQLGQVSLEVVSSGEQLDRALEKGFQIEAAAWKGQAGSAIRDQPVTSRFYTQVARVAAQRGWLRLYYLTVGGKQIAFGFLLYYKNKFYMLKPGYDPQYAPYSPSNLLCYHVLREAFDRNVAEFDFLGVADRWKLDWTKEVRPHEWLFVFPNRLWPRLLHWIKFRLIQTLKY